MDLTTKLFTELIASLDRRGILSLKDFLADVERGLSDPQLDPDLAAGLRLFIDSATGSAPAETGD